MRQADERDVIVVGAGLAGLAAAAYLARAGCRVMVVEKAEAPGGRARTRTLDGFHFNLGAHALYRGGPGAAVLRDLGVAFDGGAPSVSGRFAFQRGRLHTLPVGFVSLLTTGLLRPAEKLEAARLLASVERLDTDALQLLAIGAWVDAHAGSPNVRNLLHAIVRVATYTDEPEHQSAGAALEQLRRAGQGVLYLHGGWQQLVDGLRRCAETAGAELVTHTPAASLIQEKTVRGVRLENGQSLLARAVVIAGSPETAAALASPGEHGPLHEWARRTLPVRASCLDVALRRLPRPEARFALGIDQPLYASVHSAVARLAPAGGGALVHLIRYGGLRGDTPDAVERRLAGLLDALQPGWRLELVRRRFLPDVVVSNAVVTAQQGGLAGRPGPAVPGVPGLWVAGDWVGTRGLLADASLASARQAAAEILDLKLRSAA
jgi:phytoene dehydrogenase-like protein